MYMGMHRILRISATLNGSVDMGRVTPPLDPAMTDTLQQEIEELRRRIAMADGGMADEKIFAREILKKLAPLLGLVQQMESDIAMLKEKIKGASARSNGDSLDGPSDS
jgi:hypothetical protein